MTATISFATANLYFHPFEAALEIIAEAGFQNIELDLFWERKEWAMAQHLRGFAPKEVARMVRRSGLKITSIHDTGGILEKADSTLGFINPALDEYLGCLDSTPDCLVFHSPHTEGDPDAGWWERISGRIAADLDRYRKAGACVTIENMPNFSGYAISLIAPAALNAFAAQKGVGVTLDTTHYAQIGVDIIEAAQILKENIRTIHLSDYLAGRTHVFVGEGALPLPGLFAAIDRERLCAVTLECSLSTINKPAQEMEKAELVGRLSEVHNKVEQLCFFF